MLTEYQKKIVASVKRRAVANPVPDRGNDGGDLLSPGTRLYSRDESQFGIVQYQGPTYYGEAGTSRRVVVLWPNGRITKPAVKGVGRNAAGRWAII